MAFFIISSSLSLANDKEQSSVSHNIYFSTADKHNSPETTPKKVFDCTDKIYTVVELQGYPLKQHQLSVRWKNPIGDTQEHTQYPFHVRQQQAKLWAWLSLSRATGAGMLQFVNPAAGLDEFIGIWQVEVRIDNKLIETGDFEVSC